MFVAAYVALQFPAGWIADRFTDGTGVGAAVPRAVAAGLSIYAMFAVEGWRAKRAGTAGTARVAMREDAE